MDDPPDLSMRPVAQGDIPALGAGCLADRPLNAVEAVVGTALRLARTRRGVGVVAVRDGAIVGFGMLTLWPHAAEISDLAVTPAQRGRGVGAAMIAHLAELARQMHAERVEIGVAAGNTRALALYRRLGFVEARVLALNPESGPEPVLYLSKALR